MTITDPNAVKFSNQQGRVAADMLSRAYTLCDAARDRWDSLGGGQSAIDVMEQDIRVAADSVVSAYLHSYLTERIWFLGVNSTIPNTSEAIDDGSPVDGRPAATGQKVHAVAERFVEFINWLLSNDATPSFSDLDRSSFAPLNTIIEASSNGPPTLTVAAAGNFMNRCGELRADYEASSNLKLGTLLAFAVNPAP